MAQFYFSGTPPQESQQEQLPQLIIMWNTEPPKILRQTLAEVLNSKRKLNVSFFGDFFTSR